MIKKLLKPPYKKVKNIIVKRTNSHRIRVGRNKVVAFHNIHKGERCFIVGNGPSLRAEDLEKLKDEICFGTHRIYKIFDKTDWRPTYYFAQDRALITSSVDEINADVHCTKFIGVVPRYKIAKVKNAIYLNLISEEFYPDLPMFSEDMSSGFYEGYTVSYMCLQMAMYMGFSEIILLGIDHNYNVELLPDGTVKHNDVKGHFSNEDTVDNIPQIFKSTLAYISAEEYAKKHNVKIYNATRGGKLNAFERIDFNSITNK